MNTRPGRFYDPISPARRRSWTGMRVVAGTLIALNVLYFAWTCGGLAMFGTMPARFKESEPQRVEQQVRPQALQVIDENAARNSRQDPPASPSASAASAP